MTVEQIELRRILTQMLADNGINRDTIVELVKDIVDEKVEKAVNRIVHHETNMDQLVGRTVKEETKEAIKFAVGNTVRDQLSGMFLKIDVNVEGID